MTTKQKRGFALLTPDDRKDIASRGGKACHAAGKGRQWTSEQAAEAGRKGGKVSRGGKGKLVEV